MKNLHPFENTTPISAQAEKTAPASFRCPSCMMADNCKDCSQFASNAAHLPQYSKTKGESIMSNFVINNAEGHGSACTGCVKLPEDIQLRQWVDCSDCRWGDYEPSQGAYWCRRFGGYDSRGGCAKGNPC